MKVQSKYMEELLERYFEGESSAGEEQQIRAFFASGNVPEHFAAFKPLFDYFNEEIERNMRVQKNSPAYGVSGETLPLRRKSGNKAVLYILLGVAACVLTLLSLSRLLYLVEPCFCSDNYVMINGHCYTDIHKVRSLAFEALQEMTTPTDNYFPEIGKDEAERRLIDNQLKELGSFF